MTGMIAPGGTPSGTGTAIPFTSIVFPGPRTGGTRA